MLILVFRITALTLCLSSAWSLALAITTPVIENCTTSKCHSSINNFSKLHGPSKVRGCTVCHQIDEGGTLKSNLPKNHPPIIPIPNKEINSTCLVCHEDKSGQGFAFSHKAIIEKTCTSCHSPHGANNKNLLKIEPLTDLCFSCHKDFKDQNHGGHQDTLNKDKSCFTCHDVHFSNEPKLLKKKISVLCLQCHNKEIKGANGKILTNIENLVETRSHKHKPVEEGKCQSCHNPHGTGESNFLVKTYTKSEPQLCFDCHKNTHSMTRSFNTTNFRNGSINLHDYHLNEVKHPLNCQTCHEVHASIQDLLIRTSTEYNTWKLPIEFRKIPDGGTCLTACHKDKTYKRTAPFKNEEGR